VPGAFVLLGQAIANNSPSLDLAGFVTPAFDVYEFDLLNVLPVTNNIDLIARVGTGPGPTWDAVSGRYAWTDSYSFPTNNGGGEGAVASQTSIKVSGAVANTTLGVCGRLRLFDPSGPGVAKCALLGEVANLHATVGYIQRNVTGVYLATTAITGMQFLFSAGNIASGTVRVYGIAK
jgi:hypothetical protein